MIAAAARGFAQFARPSLKCFACIKNCGVEI